MVFWIVCYVLWGFCLGVCCILEGLVDSKLSGIFLLSNFVVVMLEVNSLLYLLFGDGWMLKRFCMVVVCSLLRGYWSLWELLSWFSFLVSYNECICIENKLLLLCYYSLIVLYLYMVYYWLVVWKRNYFSFYLFI